jgi:hypothetical protein
MVLVDYIWIFLTFSRWLYFVWSSFLVAIKDRSFDLFIQDDKKNSIYLRIQINHAAFICVQFIGARKWKKSRPILLLSLVHLLQGDAGVCCKENSDRCHSRMPVNIICFIPLLLFCCMILFLTVLWLHQCWLCHHLVICCLYATYIVPSNV